jgi:hypothetical protein
LFLPLCLLLGAACGCNSGATARTADVHAWMVESYNTDAVTQAVVAQHTLYPYDFIDDAAVLNDLGQQHLDILARHFHDYPGTLNLRQDDTPHPLYLQRVAAVREALAQAGVRPDRVAIADGPAGGDGAASDRVLTILAAEKTAESASAQSNSPSGYGSSGASMQPSSTLMQGNQP